MDSHEVSRMLSDRALEFCQFLFPNGKQNGNTFCVGGYDGQPGESLKITISGAAAGRFIDFANKEDKGATLTWLLAKSKGLTFPEAIKQAKEWLGVKDEDFGIRKHKSKEWCQPAATDRNGIQLAEPNSKVMDYLCITRRLDPIVVAKAKLGETKDGEWIVIPYFEAGEKEAFHIKRLKVDRKDGKKEMFASRGTRRSLYGKHLIDENVSELTITEGELDALSLQSVGFPAVSIPNGVSDMAWVEEDWEWLERFERINIWFDNDEPGKLAAPDACKRLGLHRSYIVTSPVKDANQALVDGVKREEFMKWLHDAKPIEMDEIKRPTEYADEVWDYYATDWSKRGWETPWYPALPWRVRKGEFTVLSGFSGSGKTAALNHLMLHLIQQGCRVMDASLEIKPGLTLYNMTRCALGKKNNSQPEVRGAIDWISESMYFLDCIGTVSTKRLLHAMGYARKRHGIDIFVIDSLFKCGLDPTDFGSQRSFVDELTTFCNNTGAHVVLVAHSRKTQGGNELSAPNKSDVAGSSDITNAAFNVVIWYRNKLKKQKLDEAKQAIPQDIETISQWMDAPDGKVLLEKQRFGEGEEASVVLWFDPDGLQFHTHKNMKMPYFTSQ